MSFVLQPWQLMLAILAAWINQQQQVVIEYLRADNRVLKEKLGKKRILLNDDQRLRSVTIGAWRIRSKSESRVVIRQANLAMPSAVGGVPR